MKLIVTFNLLDLERSLLIARVVEPHAQVISIGSLLIYKYGSQAVARFREEFPKATLFAETRIIDRPKEAVKLFAQAGASWVSVLAGAGQQKIHGTCTAAGEFGTKVILDLADSSSVGQDALEAQRLGADGLLFHKPSVDDEGIPFIDTWQMITGNTNLPVYLSAHASQDTIKEIIGYEPSGIIVGSSIINAEDPETEVRYFAEHLKKYK